MYLSDIVKSVSLIYELLLKVFRIFIRYCKMYIISKLGISR